MYNGLKSSNSVHYVWNVELGKKNTKRRRNKTNETYVSTEAKIYFTQVGTLKVPNLILR